MPNQSPHGNLTATLVVVAVVEVVIDRVLGRLFLSPGCQGGVGCVLLRTGPFLMHLTGILALAVGGGGILGHLRRGELFPRGMRLTIAVLSAVFFLLLGLSLIFGRIPERYQVHLETSFAFVVGLLVLSFVGGTAVPVRPRVGVALFALPPILHIAALVAARAGWLSQGAVTPDRLTAAGEVALLFAGVAAPSLLLPAGVPRGRLGAALALAAGLSAFFFVAYLGRTDLIQTLALYGLQLDLPRALSAMGLLYTLALFGFVTAAGVLVLSPGAGRLGGFGLCLIAVAGYQTSSPVSLALSLCGMLSLATGTVRMFGTIARREAPLSASEWRALLEAIAAAIAEPAHAGAAPVLIEISPLPSSAGGDGEDADLGSIKAQRRGRLVEVKVRRLRGVVREVEATVGVPDATPPDAAIESHEAWLGRRPDQRVSLPRIKTGDPVFDRRLSVHGRAPIHQGDLRRRVLKLADGTITLWKGRAARFMAPGNPAEGLRRFAWPFGPAVVRALVEITDTLIELVDADEETAPPGAAA